MSLSGRKRLLDLSEEILVLIVEQLDRHEDLLQTRLSCRKLKDLSDKHMYRNVVITLDEEVTERWANKLQSMPPHINQIKHLTILNRSKIPGGFFFPHTISQSNSYRIYRWQLLFAAYKEAAEEARRAAVWAGVKFFWDWKIPDNHLVSFSWRHAIPLGLNIVELILLKHSQSLGNLEISMIGPPRAGDVSDFVAVIARKTLPKMRSLKYHGLSHTEPIDMNNPEAGGRFRMLRPIFRKVYDTLEELCLTQDHCISQVGKTPLINGRVFPDDYLCTLDELYTHRHDPHDASRPVVELNLQILELGGFFVGSLFDASDDLAASPRVRISLPHLRRLVLNECHQSTSLFREMSLRHEEINLHEFGCRFTDLENVEDLDEETDAEELAAALTEFLTCFKGLQLLSVLWHCLYILKGCDTIMEHHADSLTAFSWAQRMEMDEDDDFGPIYRFTTKPKTLSNLMGVLPQNKTALLREVGLQLDRVIADPDYLRLKQLSQFEDLRTVQIRNFPPLQRHDKPQPVDAFWYDTRGEVTSAALDVAAAFAEHIALPFYGAPAGTGPDIAESQEVIKTHGLDTLAERHATKRDQRLQLGGQKLKSSFRTSVPNRDITPKILEQRADIDFQFADIMRRVDARSASLEENIYFDEYVHRVRSTLGYEEPPDEDKPKLKLLIVGDWRYRDQLNMTGPRTWHPEAWQLSQTPQNRPPTVPRVPVVDDSDEDMSEDDFSDRDDSNAQPKLRSGFKREFDICLLPIFFKIDWEAEKSSPDRKWRWKAKPTVLEQNSLEGYTALGDVRSLDFAWQN